jgi:hypothetical protein
VQVSADDDGGTMQGGQEPQGQGSQQTQGAHQTRDAQQSHHAHQSQHAHQEKDAQQSHGRPASRPDTGGGTGFSDPADADSKGDPALPPEAVEALQEAGQSGNQGTDPGARIAAPAAGTSQLVLRTTAGTTAGRSVTLRCDPPGGTHPKAAEACADVAKSRGDLKTLPANQNPRACFMIYAPVTVSAQGDWRGQPVKFTTQFPNTCVMHDKTGSIFDF